MGRMILDERVRIIPMSVQDETNSLVLLASGFVARSLQTAAGMRLAGASPEAKSPARLSLILNAHWNYQCASHRFWPLFLSSVVPD